MLGKHRRVTVDRFSFKVNIARKGVSISLRKGNNATQRSLGIATDPFARAVVSLRSPPTLA